MKKTKLKLLIGKHGLTLCKLRPTGYILIEGEMYESQAGGLWAIDKHTTVIVTGVLMNKFLQVREIAV